MPPPRNPLRPLRAAWEQEQERREGPGERRQEPWEVPDPEQQGELDRHPRRVEERGWARRWAPRG